MSDASSYRIALVGLGPRGFGCLERLALEVARRGSTLPLLDVTAHDPCAHPGAGPPYTPDQPDGMLLNFSAGHVNLWSPDHDLLPPGERLDFVAWLQRNHPAWASGDAFVPRRLLGGYLADAFASLKDALPQGLRFRHVRGEVTAVEAWGGADGGANVAMDGGLRWSIRHEDASLDREGVHQVMVATGHGTWSRHLGFDRWNAELPEAPATGRVAMVYPVRQRLSTQAVPEGAMVGIRGFALTAIDAVLALTEGRGGRFVPQGGHPEGGGIPRYEGGQDGRHHGRHPGRHPGRQNGSHAPTDSGTGEVTIVPFSRSGLPLLAKPGAELAHRSSELNAVWEPLREGILEARGLTPGELLQRLHRAGLQALAALGGRTPSTLVPSTSTPAPAAPPGPLRIMERSVLVAQGILPPDVAWARGEAWRQAYPAIVSRAGEGGMAAAFPAAYARLACAMERYAFGPPASSLARMVSLARAGRLELGALRSPRIHAHEGRLVLEGAEASFPLDVLVNAVIPPPGVHDDTPLLQGLVRSGHATLAPGQGEGASGLVISPSAASIGRGGTPTPGLSVVGRATEGWVVGNDTLSRTLHDHTRRWAERVAEEASVPIRERRGLAADTAGTAGSPR